MLAFAATFLYQEYLTKLVRKSRYGSNILHFTYGGAILLFSIGLLQFSKNFFEFESINYEKGAVLDLEPKYF